MKCQKKHDILNCMYYESNIFDRDLTNIFILLHRSSNDIIEFLVDFV